MEQIRKYARLLVECGVALQKGQALCIRATAQVADFAKIVVEEAYKLGASDVDVLFTSDGVTRARYEGSSAEALADGQQWSSDVLMNFANRNACFLSLVSPDPDLFVGVEPAKVAAAMKGTAKVLKPYREKSMANAVRWSIGAVPNAAWAKKLFPELSEADGIKKLWDTILSCSRADGDDPSADWLAHTKNLQAVRKKLNDARFVSIHFKSEISGTDITLGIADDHLWGGGDSLGQDGVIFSPNVPTEEIFTAPHKGKINGRVVASLPLNYAGNLIEGFEATYKDGRVEKYSAKKGEELLGSIFSIDEGAKSLGEIALVPYSSPINRTGILFYNTLFDENASCHLAFGNGYPISVSGDRSPEALSAKGVNSSSTHVDFMFGTSDMVVTGINADGSTATIMKNGEYIL